MSDTRNDSQPVTREYLDARLDALESHIEVKLERGFRQLLQWVVGTILVAALALAVTIALS